MTLINQCFAPGFTDRFWILICVVSVYQW